MDSLLKRIVNLIQRTFVSSGDGSYKLVFIPSSEEKQLLVELAQNDCVQEINRDGTVISAEGVDDSETITVEIIYFGLKKYGYYDAFYDFVNHNEFSAPDAFYIRDINYFHNTAQENGLVKSYFTIIDLIACLSGLSLFQSNEDGKTLYFMQEKSATVLPILYSRELLEENEINIDEVENFIMGVSSLNDKKKIYLKELIDYLNTEQIDHRFSHLYRNFSFFYHNCEAAYGFFLSDFSYSKLKLELESSILDYSKNIRSIINDSQSKLIAIPAAFLVASSQLNLETTLSAKNFLIVFSSFVFSILIEIFIRNQESSLKIFADNIANYKITFKLKNAGIDKKENDTLQQVISSSFQAIDNELKNQKSRLNLIRYINWGMSSFLILIIFVVFKAPSIRAVLLGLIHLIFKTSRSC